MGGHTALTNANFPVDEEGHTYHVGVKRGQVANRIITVGDPERAISLATYLDGGHVIDPTNLKAYLNFVNQDLFIKTSSRLFTTVTGRYQGVPISIIAIGMGVPMMDFFVREIRAVVSGPLHIIRFGSCGSLGNARAGDMIVATNSVACSRNYDYFLEVSEEEDQDDLHAAMAGEDLTPADVIYNARMKSGKGPYSITRPVDADPELTAALTSALRSAVPSDVQVHQGLDVTGDSFYGSQGRRDESFRDANGLLFKYLKQTLPTAECLQMETFGLLHLAKTARPLPSKAPSIRAAACAMVFAHRLSNTWIKPELVDVLKDAGAKAVLSTLISVPMDETLVHPEQGSVWERKC